MLGEPWPITRTRQTRLESQIFVSSLFQHTIFLHVILSRIKDGVKTSMIVGAACNAMDIHMYRLKIPMVQIWLVTSMD